MVSVRLKDERLWRIFHTAHTEMILTPKGRCMFPRLEVEVDGLERHTDFSVRLYFDRVDNYRYKFLNRQWLVDDSIPAEDPPPSHALFPKKGGRALGMEWTTEAISFAHIKLSNKPAVANPDATFLQSMHKWRPRIEIRRWEDGAVVADVSLFLAEFIAVTAYGDVTMSELKKLHNPFAGGERPCRSALIRHQLELDFPRVAGEEETPKRKRKRKKGKGNAAKKAKITEQMLFDLLLEEEGEEGNSNTSHLPSLPSSPATPHQPQFTQLPTYFQYAHELMSYPSLPAVPTTVYDPWTPLQFMTPHPYSIATPTPSTSTGSPSTPFYYIHDTL